MEEKSKSMKVVKVSLERHIPLLDKTCPQCGKDFQGVKIQQFCSKACARKASYWRHPETYRKKRMESYRRQNEKAAEK